MEYRTYKSPSYCRFISMPLGKKLKGIFDHFFTYQYWIKKYKFILAYCLICSFSAQFSNAQVVGIFDADSLEIIWNDSDLTDSIRLDAFEKFYHQKWYNTNADSMQIVAKTMLDYARSTDQTYFEGIALLHLGHSHLMYTQSQMAIQYFDSSMAILEGLQNNSNLALVNLFYSYAYDITSDYPISKQYLMKSIKIAEAVSDTGLIARGYLSLGAINSNQGNYKRSREFLRKSLSLFQELKLPMYINALKSNIGYTYGMQGEYKKALDIYLDNVDFSLQTNDKMNLSTYYLSIGQLYNKLGDLRNSLKYMNMSLSLVDELGIWLDYGDIMANIGDVYLDRGNYTEAFSYYKKSLELNETHDNKKGIAESINRIGNLYYNLKTYDKSLEYYFRSLKIFEEFGFLSETADLQLQIGKVYSVLKDEKKANLFFEKSFELNKRIGRINAISDYYRVKGSNLRDKGELVDSYSYFMKSLEIREKIGDKRALAEIYTDIGDLNIDNYNLNEGLKWCLMGYKMAVSIGALEEEMNASFCLYTINKAIGRGNEALAYHERYLLLQDSLNTDEASRKLQLMEFDRQRLTDSLRTEEDRLKTELNYLESISNEKDTRNTIMFAGIGILVLAIVLFGRMRFIRKTNKKLEAKNKLIAKEKERAEESERAKEQFFDNVSHEFRTPLTLILGPLENTIESTTDVNIKPGLETMHRNAIHLQEMINELLSLSKLEFGKIKLQAKEENIVQLTEEYAQSFESLADQKKINLRFRSSAKTLKAWIDAEQFRKILANLISNAFKFTTTGGVISIAVNKSKEEEGVLITISDTGIGIPEDKLSQIFDRFYQVGEPSQAHQAGTGIGLALTKELVDLHHGTIKVESEKGQGTSFVVFIPSGSDHLSIDEISIKKGSVSEETNLNWAIEKEISGHVIEEEIKKKNELPILLIAEDNKDMRLYIKSHFESEYTIIEASDGEEGLQKTIEHIPDLIISDVMMPKMDGYQMTDMIKEDQRTSHIPVLILTARSSVESRIEGLETGADAYLIKPFNARELQVRVKKMIEQRIKLRQYFSEKLESLNDFLSKDPKLTSMDQQFIAKAQEVTERLLGDSNFNTKTFAAEMALSRVQLHRKIKALTNKTTTEFIRTIRLNRAAILLKNQTDNVTQIAYDVGFSSLSYFTKAFKEQFGKTPSEFAGYA